MILTIRSLIDPTLRIGGGAGDALCIRAPASATDRAMPFIFAAVYLSWRRIPATGGLVIRASLLALLLAASLPAYAQTSAPAAQPAAEVAPNDYNDPKNWL